MRPPRKRRAVLASSPRSRAAVPADAAANAAAAAAAAAPSTPPPPPSSSSSSSPQARPRPKLLVSTPPDRTIHAPLGDIAAALNARLAATGAGAARRALFRKAAHIVSAQVALTHADLRRRLQNKYLPFYAASNRQPLFVSRPPTEAQLDTGELQFVCRLVDALMAARYSPLTRQQQRAALTAAFRLSVPARVEFGRLDASLLSKFWRSTPALAALRGRLPRTADRVAIFHRGVGVARARGLFLAEKLDLLALYAVSAPLAALAQFFRLVVVGRLVFAVRVLLRSAMRAGRRVSPFSSAFVTGPAAERAIEAREGATPADKVWGGGTASASSSGSSSGSGSSSSSSSDEDDDGEEDDGEEDEDGAAGWLQYYDESSSSSSSSSSEEEEEEEGREEKEQGERQQQQQQQGAAAAAGAAAARSPAPSPSSFDSALSSLDEERQLYERWRRQQRRRRRRALDQWANTSVGGEAAAPAALHDGRHVVERRTLAHVLPTAGAVVRSFFKPVELQEPAFGEVIIIYREREPVEPPAAAAEAEGAEGSGGGGGTASSSSPILRLRKRRQQQQQQQEAPSVIGAEAVARTGEADVVAGLQRMLEMGRQQAQQAHESVAGAVASAATAAADAAQAAASAAAAAAEAAITTAEAKPGALASSALAGLAQGVLSGDGAGGEVRETVVSAGMRQRMSPVEGEGGREQQQQEQEDGRGAASTAAEAAAFAAVAAAAAATAAAAAASNAAAASTAATASPPPPPPPPPKPMPYARNIQLRRFRDVPLADLELCVPFVELGVRAAQALRLAVATLGAVAAAVAALVEGHREAVLAAAAAGVGATVAAATGAPAPPPPGPPPGSLLPILWAALAATVGAALHARDEIAAQRSSALTSLLELQQSKCSECQGAVIGVVTEALAESTLKEALLALGVLVAAREEAEEEERRRQAGGGEDGGRSCSSSSSGGRLTANEVSQRAQRLLSEDLGVHGAVYSARAVLPALERAGLVVRHSGAPRRHHHHQHHHLGGIGPSASSSSAPVADTFEAVPLEAAMRVLEEDWATAHERVDLSMMDSASEGEGAFGGGGGGGGDGGAQQASSPGPAGPLLPDLLFGGNGSSPWLRHAPATTPSPSPQPPPLAAAAVAGQRRRAPPVAAPPPRPLRPLLLRRPAVPRAAPRAAAAAAARRSHPLLGALW